jgi:Ca2+-transporting ATPase
MAIATLAFASARQTARLSGLRTRTARVIAAATVGSTIILIQTPFLAGLLHLEPLHLVDWSVAIAGSLLAAALAGVFAIRLAPGGDG